jgi:hypothetical protein
MRFATLLRVVYDVTLVMYHRNMKTVTVTEFKRNAVHLLRQVRNTGESIQITSQGKPVGRLCPAESMPNTRVFGASRGLATIAGDIIGPIVDPADFDGVTL